MAWDMRKGDIGIMTHPSVPVAAADAACSDFDHRRMLTWDRFRDILDGDGALETPEDCSAHGILRGELVGFIGQDTRFNRAATFTNRLGVVDADRDLADSPLDNPFQVGLS